MLTWAAHLVLAASVLVSAITWNQPQNPNDTSTICFKSATNEALATEVVFSA
jgi:hypothetical protein